MARNGQNPEFEIVAGGERYVWRLQRAAQDSGKRSERSGMALERCRVAGVAVDAHLAGGIKAWIDEGLPTVRPGPSGGGD